MKKEEKFIIFLTIFLVLITVATMVLLGDDLDKQLREILKEIQLRPKKYI